MNIWNGIGRLTKDGEFTVTEKGSQIYKNSVAVDIGWGDKKRTMYLDIVQFGKRAEYIANYGSKGIKVAVSGLLDVSDFQRNDGTKGKSVVINVSEIEILERTTVRQSTVETQSDDLLLGAKELDDDDLPF